MKQGTPAEILAECQHIDMMDVGNAPMLYARGDGFFIMENLDEWQRRRPWIAQLSEILQREWLRPWPLDPSWRENFTERFGFEPPGFVAEPPCFIHGDPTRANVMNRSGRMVLIDPKPPGRGIPSFRHVDAGKILQSLLGWEYVVSGGVEPLPTQDDLSEFNALIQDANLNPKAIAFWCVVHLLRIKQRSSSGPIAGWADTSIALLRERYLGAMNITLGG